MYYEEEPINVNKIIEQVYNTIQTLDSEWVDRCKSIRTLIPLAQQLEPVAFCKKLNRLKEPFNVQLRDIRSAVIKDVCESLCLLAELLQEPFETIADHLAPSLFKLIMVTKEIIAQSADKCIQVFIQYCHSNKLFAIILENLTHKSQILRYYCFQYLQLFVEIVNNKQHLSKVKDVLFSALQAGLDDASSSVRVLNHSFYWLLYSFFPKKSVKLLESLTITKQKLIKNCQPEGVEYPPIGFAQATSSATKPTNEKFQSKFKKQATAAAPRRQTETNKGIEILIATKRGQPPIKEEFFMEEPSGSDFESSRFSNKDLSRVSLGNTRDLPSRIPRSSLQAADISNYSLRKPGFGGPSLITPINKFRSTSSNENDQSMTFAALTGPQRVKLNACKSQTSSTMNQPKSGREHNPFLSKVAPRPTKDSMKQPISQPNLINSNRPSLSSEEIKSYQKPHNRTEPIILHSLPPKPNKNDFFIEIKTSEPKATQSKQENKMQSYSSTAAPCCLPETSEIAPITQPTKLSNCVVVDPPPLVDYTPVTPLQDMHTPVPTVEDSTSCDTPTIPSALPLFESSNFSDKQKCFDIFDELWKQQCLNSTPVPQNDIKLAIWVYCQCLYYEEDYFLVQTALSSLSRLCCCFAKEIQAEMKVPLESPEVVKSKKFDESNLISKFGILGGVFKHTTANPLHPCLDIFATHVIQCFLDLYPPDFIFNHAIDLLNLQFQVLNAIECNDKQSPLVYVSEKTLILLNKLLKISDKKYFGNMNMISTSILRVYRIYETFTQNEEITKLAGQFLEILVKKTPSIFASALQNLSTVLPLSTFTSQFPQISISSCDLEKEGDQEQEKIQSGTPTLAELILAAESSGRSPSKEGFEAKINQIYKIIKKSKGFQEFINIPRDSMLYLIFLVISEGSTDDMVKCQFLKLAEFLLEIVSTDLQSNFTEKYEYLLRSFILLHEQTKFAALIENCFKLIFKKFSNEKLVVFVCGFDSYTVNHLNIVHFLIAHSTLEECDLWINSFLSSNLFNILIQFLVHSDVACKQAAIDTLALLQWKTNSSERLLHLFNRLHLKASQISLIEKRQESISRKLRG